MSFYEWQAEETNYFYFVRRGNYETDPHFHGAVEFHFVVDGEQEITVDGERRTMKSGDGCFCDGFSVHQLTPFQGKSAFCLLFDADYFSRAVAYFDGKVPPTFFRFENFDLLENLYRLCTQNGGKGDGRHAIFGGAIQILLGEIAKNTPLVTRKTERKNSLICNVLQYAANHIKEDLSLRAIAKTFGYSHEHISRVLHKHLSEGWSSYVNRLRVRFAQRLLKEDPYSPVLSIALTCGFESPNTFYRAYKKEFGAPPRRPMKK